jgi:putative ABC transport system permease protein
MFLLSRLRGTFGLAMTQLRYGRTRTLLAIAGVALAVMSMVLLAGVGVGVLDTGEQQFDQADRDLWITGGPIELTTARGGGFENSIEGAHRITAELNEREEIRTAAPLGFETLYIRARETQEFETTLATGVTGAGGSSVQITDGEGLTNGTAHYAGGSYEGPMTNEVIIDQQTASRLDIGVGDTVQLGGSLAIARETEYTVVGISPTFSQMLGSSTVVLPLGELQTLTGTTTTDPATFITITVQPGTDVETLQTELQSAYPEYEVRTNREQLEATVAQQAVVIVAGGVLSVLSIVSGIALTMALFTMLVYQQREQFAALKAIGIRQTSIIGVATGQGIVLGFLGGLVGVGVSVPAARLLNRLMAALVGFEGLVQLQPRFLVGGFVIALGIGTLSAATAAWRLSRLPPINRLQAA